MGQRFESWGLWCRAAGAVGEQHVGRMILGIVCGLTGVWRKQTPTCSSLRCGQSLPTPSAAWLCLFIYLFISKGRVSKLVESLLWTLTCSLFMFPAYNAAIVWLWGFPRPNLSSLCTASQVSLAPQMGRTRGTSTPEHSPATVPCAIVAFYSCSPDAVVKLCLLDSLVTWEVSASLCR